MTPPADKCVMCKRRITDSGWVPCCCEVCWDSMDADDHRIADHIFRATGESMTQPPRKDAISDEEILVRAERGEVGVDLDELHTLVPETGEALEALARKYGL